MKRYYLAVLIMLSFIVMTTPAMARPWQGWMGSGGWGSDSPYQKLYDRGTEENIWGTVADLRSRASFKGMSSAARLILKTDKEIIPVFLGPSWFIERLDTKIQKGDEIEVKGSRVIIEGKPAIIAAAVKRGDDILILRDEKGVPAWVGWHRVGVLEYK